jgi:arabinan endo-1,5-alpha-L-arabinosidase
MKPQELNKVTKHSWCAKHILYIFVLFTFSFFLFPFSLAQPLDFEGDYFGVHDPAMIEENGKYYLFSTGGGLEIRCSDNLITWDLCGGVYFRYPKWIKEVIPGVGDLWAPDISFYNGKYQVYYAASTFGSNESAIGLATNTTLDKNHPDYKWQDEGMVIKSERGFDWNAIDPNFVLDKDGNPWLSFGSFWSGIKLIKLDKETGRRIQGDTSLISIASRAAAPRAIEAPFIIYRAPYYYLFVSFDQCCQGVNSTYNTRVGRSEDISGPYLDMAGLDMNYGGGTLLREGTERWKGPGHSAIFTKDGIDYLVYHSYDAENQGRPTLRMEPIIWLDSWPTLSQAE